jgi:hypothetical protein
MDYSLVDSGDPQLYDIRTHVPGPSGSLPITAEMLLNRPSGDLFGLGQDAGMGWDPRKLGGKEAFVQRTARPLRLAITPATGKLVC